MRDGETRPADSWRKFPVDVDHKIGVVRGIVAIAPVGPATTTAALATMVAVRLFNVDTNGLD